MNSFSELFDLRMESLQGNYSDLEQRFESLYRFEDAAQWDKDAQALIELNTKLEKEIKNYQDQQEKILIDIQQEKSKLTFLKRMTYSSSNEKENTHNIEVSKEQIENLMIAREAIIEMMDKTPVSKKEQQDMMKELIQIKKDLALEKRELNAKMKEIRADARRKNAFPITDTTDILSSLVHGVKGHTRIKRQIARMDKERQVKPHEDQASLIESQIIDIEKKINWVSKFEGKSNEPESIAHESEPLSVQINLQINTETLRCSYCGRRVIQNEVCEGCGSTDVYKSPV